MRSSLFALALSFTPFLTSALSCLGVTGEATDSWSIFKAPETGDDYLYATESENLYQPSSSLNSTSDGALAKTIGQLWASSDISYVLWNDSPPGQGSNYNYTVGHTKGLFAVDDEGNGFWLTHSIPLYPQGPKQTPTGYSGIGSNAWTYGQNAYCLSVSLSALDTMAYALQLTIPSIYEAAITNAVATQAPNISALIKGKTSSAAICANHTLSTQAGKIFSFYTKSTQWNKDLWYSCIAPSLKKDLLVESWIRGSAIGPSCSGSYQVYDVQAVDFSEDPSFSWSEYNDHSKWAVSTDGEITCVGDINRMTTQYVRGGGAICFKGAKYSLLNSVSKENAC